MNPKTILNTSWGFILFQNKQNLPISSFKVANSIIIINVSSKQRLCRYCCMDALHGR